MTKKKTKKKAVKPAEPPKEFFNRQRLLNFFVHYFGPAVIATAIFLVLLYLDFVQLLLQQLVIANPSLSQIIYTSWFGYVVGQVLQVILLGLIIGLAFLLMKVSRPYRLALWAGSVALFIFSSIFAYFQSTPDTWYLASGATFIIFFLAILSFSKARKEFFITIFTIATLLAVGVVSPFVVSTLNYMGYSRDADRNIAKAREELRFNIYRPSYVPAGLKIQGPELFNYNAVDRNHYVQYQIGQYDLIQSAPLKNQEKLLNFADNCDIRELYFSTRLDIGISERAIERSQKDPAPCRVLGTTDSGTKVYVSGSKNTQYQYYFIDKDGTNVIMRYKPGFQLRQSGAYEGDVIKILNSLEQDEKSKLGPGTK